MQTTSLKSSFTIFIVFFTIIFVSGTGYFLRNIASENITERIMQKNMTISSLISNQIDMYLENATEAVQTAAAFSSESNGDMVNIKNEIFRMYDNFSYFDLIFFMDHNGKIQFSKPANEITAVNIYTHRDYFIEVSKNKKPYISDLFLSTILSRPHFVVAAPVFSNGEFIGLIGGGIPLENIKEIVKTNQQNFDGNIWIFDRTGSLVVDPYDEDIHTIRKTSNSVIKIDSQEYDYIDVIKSSEGFVGQREIGLVDYESSGSFVERSGWLVLVEQSSGSLALETENFNSRLRNILFIIIMLSTFAGIFFSRSITKPIDKLVKDVELIGSSFHHISKDDDDFFEEVQELRHAFYNMESRIKKQINELEESNISIRNLKRRLSDVLESFTNAVIVFDSEGKISFVNKAVSEITGFDKETVIVENMNVFFYTIGLDINQFKNSNYPNEFIQKEMETEIKNNKSKIIPVQVSVSELNTENFTNPGFIMIIRDLTQVKYYEEELKKEDRIRTLGQLSASIIHDIGNPLAGISNLLEVLKEEYVDENTKNEVIGILEKEVGDLNKMVIQFLDFTKNKGIDKKQVNILDIIDEIISLFKIETKNKEIKVSKDLPSYPVLLTLNRMEIKQALINIYKNALNAEDIKTVYVSVKADKNVIVIIEDDGCGIKKEDMKKIFDPFFTTSEAGNGLGLSIAYKSIKDNGGNIGLESTYGKGTRFTISFPAEDVHIG